MQTKILIDVQEVKQRLHKLFMRQCAAWLQGEAVWPLSINLNIPTERIALDNLSAVQEWVTLWQQWRGVGELHWVTRHWQIIGKQAIPEKLVLKSPEEVSMWIGEQDNWNRATRRYQEFSNHFPALKLAILKHTTLLSTYTDEDWQKLVLVLAWFITNPSSQLYLRQLPIQGIDTKWIEQRKSLLQTLLKIVLNRNEENDFYSIAGLKREPTLIRLRLLDPALRGRCCDLDYLGLSRFEVSKLNLPIKNVFIIENIRTGLAFHDLPNSLVIMGLGYDAEFLANFDLLHQANCYYWGDIDTHGFAILHRIRHYLSNVKSLLMDQNTLLTHKPLWSKEEKPAIAENLSNLTEAEHALYTTLRENKWGSGVRLEQERINWSIAWDFICELAIET
jgi:hypothetical protein